MPSKDKKKKQFMASNIVCNDSNEFIDIFLSLEEALVDEHMVFFLYC